MHVRSLPCLGPRPPFFCLGHSHFSREDNVFHFAWGHLLKPEHAFVNQRRDIDLFLFTNVYCFRTFFNGAHKNYCASTRAAFTTKKISWWVMDLTRRSTQLTACIFNSSQLSFRRALCSPLIAGSRPCYAKVKSSFHFHYKKNKLMSDALNSTQHTTDRMYFQQQPTLISPNSVFTSPLIAGSGPYYAEVKKYGYKSYFFTRALPRTKSNSYS